jgi:hypothetical protein
MTAAGLEAHDSTGESIVAAGTQHRVAWSLCLARDRMTKRRPPTFITLVHHFCSKLFPPIAFEETKKEKCGKL